MPVRASKAGQPYCRGSCGSVSDTRTSGFGTDGAVSSSSVKSDKPSITSYHTNKCWVLDIQEIHTSDSSNLFAASFSKDGVYSTSLMHGQEEGWLHTATSLAKLDNGDALLATSSIVISTDEISDGPSEGSVVHVMTDEGG